MPEKYLEALANHQRSWRQVAGGVSSLPRVIPDLRPRTYFNALLRITEPDRAPWLVAPIFRLENPNSGDREAFRPVSHPELVKILQED